MSAEGLIIDGYKRSKWEIGRKLGAGAFGQVHAIKPASKNAMSCPADKWVAKVCPEPPTDGKAATKRDATRAAHMLHYEGTVYQSKVPLLQGTDVPLLPSMDRPEPKYFIKTNDFNFLVMERMQHPLMAIVPMLVDPILAAGSPKKVAIGPIAARFVSILQAVHANNHLVVDIKPENFMLANGNDGMENCTELAARVRLLDLGLAQPYSIFQNSNSPMMGTPLYASLNVHAGSSPSWRDDLESIGYVIAELVIRVVAALESTTGKYEDANNPSYLPWSRGNSDEAVGKLKRESVDSPGSSFYARMGKGSAPTIIRDFLFNVRSLSFRTKPDYDMLCKLLLPLTVEAGGSGPSLDVLSDNMERTTGRKRAAIDPLDNPKPAKKSAKKPPLHPKPYEREQKKTTGISTDLATGVSAPTATFVNESAPPTLGCGDGAATGVKKAAAAAAAGNKKSMKAPPQPRAGRVKAKAAVVQSAPPPPPPRAVTKGPAAADMLRLRALVEDCTPIPIETQKRLFKHGIRFSYTHVAEGSYE